MPEKTTTLLLVCDGWGHAPDDYPAENNAMACANTPYWRTMLETWPNTLIGSSGRKVGLPDGIMGNSEVGHLNLGAGRVVWQEITRIDNAIEKDGLWGRDELRQPMEKARDQGRRLHLMGLVSDGGVHSMDRHYYALLRLAAKVGVPSDRVFLHAWLDGRDTPPRSGREYVRQLEEKMHDEDLGRIGVVSGRYFAMDRDKRWDRTKKAYDALVLGEAAHKAESGVEAVEKAYEREENDEFVIPTLVCDGSGAFPGRMESGDQVVFFNFRPDRTRQLSHALVDDQFDGFDRDEDLRIELYTMTQYEEGLKAKVAFPPKNIENTLGEVVSNAGRTQLRIAETEKYAHVTYFFSGGREKEFEGEDRILIPSPKVATYDLQPEMSLPEVAEKLEEAIRSRKYDLIVSNFANGDMVGHTGILEAAIKAAETVNAALSRVIPALLDIGGAGIVTADHGNCEQMWNYEENCPNTQHTTTPTPLVLVGDKWKNANLRDDGCLGNVSPTILQLIGLDKPSDMECGSMILD